LYPAFVVIASVVASHYSTAVVACATSNESMSSTLEQYAAGKQFKL